MPSFSVTPGSVVFDQHVRALDETAQDLAIGVGLEVQHDRALASVERDERRWALAEVVADARRLDLHHVGAKQLELLGAERARKGVRQVDHADAVERLHRGGNLTQC